MLALSVGLVGFVLSVTGIHAPCPIELHPPSVVVKYGDPVSVNCSTSSSINGMGWEAQEGGISVRRVNHLTWSVESLKTWTASPKCYIYLQDHEQCLQDLKLVLYTFPERISISGPDVMHDDTNYNLTCDITNVAPLKNLTVRWYKGDTLIEMRRFKNDTKTPVNVVDKLSGIATKKDNGKKFRCEAHLDLAPDGPQLRVSSEEHNITVYYGPDLQCCFVEMPEGETLESRCPITGNPTPAVKWLKNGHPTDPNIPMNRENAGVYVVEAKGRVTITREVLVHVQYGPELFCQSIYTVVENSPNSFNCTIQGFPKPNMTIYKDSDEVDLPENLTRNDAGQYLITASNELSSVNFTFEIIVMYPPSEIVELEDSEVEVGSAVWLKCSSTGNPRPKYFWDYYRTANVIEKSEDGVSLLHIYNATAANMGSYTCNAQNKIGQTSKTVRVTVQGVKQECPVEIISDTDATFIMCHATSTNYGNVKEIYWETSDGTRVNGKTLFIDSRNFGTKPICTAEFEGIGTCRKALSFPLYKMPDDILIRSVHNSSSVLEDKEYQLECEIVNVAPARNLSVRWYQGNETIEPAVKGPLRLTGCLPENDTHCDISVTNTPVNVSSTISITLGRNHSGAQFRCEARLVLGPEKPHPNKMSSPLNITVYYKPVINTTKLPKTIPVFRGYPEELVCEADGHPPPKIQWLYSSEKDANVSNNTLTVKEAGRYNCSATNDVDSISHEVEVILKEDYLPLIAGFVALTVVVISIIFIFIYSIYYTNTKMRRYSLKNPKLSNQNGNVAHNGWDLQLPMTKLS